MSNCICDYFLVKFLQVRRSYKTRQKPGLMDNNFTEFSKT